MVDETKRCPSCGQEIKAAAVLCRFCRYSFQGGVPAPPAMSPPAPPPTGSPKTLIIVLVIVGVLLIACLGLPITAALLLPAIARATQQAKIASCQNNLSQLWKMQHVYMVQFGGREKLFPTETGAAFWVRLSQTSPPLIDPSMADLYDCPLEGTHVIMRRSVRSDAPYLYSTDYRGPSSDVNEYVDAAAVGADRIENHRRAGRGGGNVLRKSGDVMEYEAEDPVWRAAAETTQP